MLHFPPNCNMFNNLVSTIVIVILVSLMLLSHCLVVITVVLSTSHWQQGLQNRQMTIY
jgi:hypothetical protein